MPIYFPYSVDFRGRAYPIPPHFNHLGNDISRSLLVFEQPKRLGHEGLRWLKIHLANVFGNDKLTFVEREQFIDANMDKVMASVDDPFGPDEATHGWWRGADKPWLTLGVAIDLVDAVRSGKPEEHMSRTPIHQDGSCNGRREVDGVSSLIVINRITCTLTLQVCNTTLHSAAISRVQSR